MTLKAVLALLGVLLGREPTSGAVVHARAIHAAVERGPLPGGWSAEKTTAVMLVTARAEGGFCLACARGDGGVAVTTWQIHARSEAHAKALEADPAYAARYALFIIRLSAALCPDAELAPYCGGCKSQRARALSAARMAIARSLEPATP